MGLPKQTRQLGDQGGGQKDYSTASHELLHALALGPGVVLAVAF